MPACSTHSAALAPLRTIGRPRIVGARQTGLAQRLRHADTLWHRLDLGGRRAVEVASGTAEDAPRTRSVPGDRRRGAL